MKIAIIGATGAVGRTILNIIEESFIEITNLELFASKKSEGKELLFRGKKYFVNLLSENNLKNKSFDVVFFSADSNIAKKYVLILKSKIIIDNSSAFRKDKEIPLIIPGINGFLLDSYEGIIANPNCSTIQLIMALFPIHKIFKIKKIVISTYQAVSGAGETGIKELKNQIDGAVVHKCFPCIINGNVIPEIGNIFDNGFTEEEEKIKNETHKIFNDFSIDIVATAVRVPVINGHSESVFVECEEDVKIDIIKKTWEETKNIIYCEDLLTPLAVNNSDDSYCSRLRYGFDKKSFLFWNVADNLRVGAATNAVRIMMEWLKLNRG